MGANLKFRLQRAVPWWAKIGAKLILAQLNISPRFCHRIGFFDQGSTLDPDYAIAVFRSHWTRASGLPAGFRYLEIGPGESIATAIIAWAFGASDGVLVDVGDFLVRDVAVYRPLIRRLAGMPEVCRDVAGLEAAGSLQKLTEAISAEVRLGGVHALESLPPESVDFVFSQAALEHVALDQLPVLARELHRIQRASSIGSHHIDFMDHLQFSLHHLRFSQQVWEANGFGRRSGFYTNRLRCGALVKLFQDAGFRVAVEERRMWSELPLARAKMAPHFRFLSDDDLLTKEAIITMKKSSSASRASV